MFAFRLGFIFLTAFGVAAAATAGTESREAWEVTDFNQLSLAEQASVRAFVKALVRHGNPGRQYLETRSQLLSPIEWDTARYCVDKKKTLYLGVEYCVGYADGVRIVAVCDHFREVKEAAEWRAMIAALIVIIPSVSFLIAMTIWSFRSLST